MKFKEYLIETRSGKRLYFAHPRATYNKEVEKRSIGMIKKLFPNYIIANPNNPKVQVGADKMGFDLFYKIIDNVDIVVVMTFEDGRWGGGLYKEALYAEKNGIKVFQINPYNNTIKEINNVSNIKPLTPEETFDRISKDDQHKWKVYEDIK